MRDDLACTRYESPLGTMLLAATDAGLAGVWFEGQRHGPDPRLWRAAGPRTRPGAAGRHLETAALQLDEYFAGTRTQFDLTIAFAAGTPFQRSVWQALLAIPCGRTTSYAEIGRGLGKPQASRAVGAAVGRNPLSVVVPCHRVLGTGGALTGYAGGLERKAALLKLERALM